MCRKTGNGPNSVALYCPLPLAFTLIVLSVSFIYTYLWSLIGRVPSQRAIMDNAHVVSLQQKLTEEYSWLQVAPLEPEVMLLDAGKVTSLADCMVWRGASETSPATCGLSEVATSAIDLTSTCNNNNYPVTF